MFRDRLTELNGVLIHNLQREENMEDSTSPFIADPNDYADEIARWSCPSISGQAVSLNFERLNSLGD